MPGQPDVGDVHVDTLLTQVSIGYDPGGHIADRCFPVVGVDKQSDIYLKYNKSFWARDEGRPAAATSADRTLRAPGTNAATVGFTVDKTSTYFANNYALGMEIPDELVANADAVFDLEADATKLITSLLRLRRDRMFVADFMATGVWKTDQSITNKWSDYGASTPIEDMRTGYRTIRRQTLATPGGKILVIMGALVWDRLADHPDLLDRIKYTERGIAAPDLLASLLSSAAQYPVEVLVGNSVYTEDEEGGTAEASITYSDVWDDDVLMLWVPNTPSRMVPSAGYTFVWRPLVGGGQAVEFIRRIREERPKKTIIEAHTYLDQVAVLTDAGVYMDDAVD